MKRISVFGVDAVWNERFSRGEINYGQAPAVRSLKVRNVRGCEADWMNVSFRIAGCEEVLPDVCGLKVGEERELPLEKTAVPDDLPAGRHSCELIFEYAQANRKERSVIPGTVEILPDDHICVRLDKAHTLRTHVMTSGRTLRAFVQERTKDIDARDAGAKVAAIYNGVRALRRKYELVPMVVREDYQKIVGPEETLRYGGSCADMSLLFASLFYAARLEPVLVVLEKHMMVGCWLDKSPAQAVISDRRKLVEYEGSGRLLILDSIDACADYSRSLEAAREDARRHMLDMMEGMVVVNVCAQEGAEHVGSAYREVRKAKVFSCPVCGNPKFTDDMLSEETVRCPACGATITVPPEFRVKEEAPGAAKPDAKPEAVTETAGEAKPAQQTGEPEQEPPAVKPDVETKAPAPAPAPKREPKKITCTADMAQCRDQGAFAVAFRASRAVRAVRVPEVWQGKPVTRIARAAFQDYAICEVELPDGLLEIDDYAFSGCRNLTWIYLPEGLVRIGGGAFRGCESVTEVYVPGSVKQISPNAFARCTALRSVVIAEGVEEISESAFEGCAALEEVAVPDSMKLIRRHAFRGCPNLKPLEMTDTVRRDGDIY